MTGQDDIKALRRTGKRPAWVWVSDFPDCTLDGSTVRVAGDVPELADFRFLVGLNVIVEGSDAARVDRLVKACACAKRVVSNVLQPVDKWRSEVMRMTDTEGIVTWQC